MATNNATNTSNPISVPQGGTGNSSIIAYSPICGGITSSDPIQVVDISTSSVGDVFTSTGTTSLPVWLPNSNTGSLILLQTLTASSSASLVFDSTYITSTYTSYMLKFENLSNESSSASPLAMQFSFDNGVSYLSSGYISGCLVNSYQLTSLINVSSATYCPLSGSFAASNAKINGYLYANFPASAASFYTGRTFINAIGGAQNVSLYGGNSGILTINNIKIYFSAGNIASGKLSLYGITQ
jgi:hypothetical protein